MKGLGWLRRGLVELLADDNKLHGLPAEKRYIVSAVAGPIWREPDETDEDGGPIWTAEVQTLGGYGVIATVHGSSEGEARERQQAIIAALGRRAA